MTWRNRLAYYNSGGKVPNAVTEELDSDSECECDELSSTISDSSEVVPAAGLV